MKRNFLAPTILATLLAGGAASAQVQLDTIVVRPASGPELTFECSNLFAPKPKDVDALLQINDPTQTTKLGHKLVGVMAEACNAGIPAIVVSRGKDGKSLTWHPVVAIDGYPVAPVIIVQ